MQGTGWSRRRADTVRSLAQFLRAPWEAWEALCVWEVMPSLRGSEGLEF